MTYDMYRLTHLTVIFRTEYSANGNIALSVIVRLCPGWMLSPTFTGQYSSHLGYVDKSVSDSESKLMQRLLT